MLVKKKINKQWDSEELMDSDEAMEKSYSFLLLSDGELEDSLINAVLDDECESFGYYNDDGHYTQMLTINQLNNLIMDVDKEVYLLYTTKL